MCEGARASLFSGTQKRLTLSTLEADYLELTFVLMQVLVLRQVRRFMSSEVGVPCISVFEDIQGAVQIEQTPRYTPTIRRTSTYVTTSIGK